MIRPIWSAVIVIVCGAAAVAQEGDSPPARRIARPARVVVPQRPGRGASNIQPPVRPAGVIEQPFRVGQRPAVRPVEIPSVGITDKAVGESIKRAAEFIMGYLERGPVDQAPRAGVGIAADPSRATGEYSLCVYALIQSGLATGDERLSIRGRYMKQLVENMKRMDADGHAATYTRGIRITALAVHNRPEDRDLMRADVRYLLENVRGGCYTYGSRTPQPNVDRTVRTGDNSNAQYGLLGVWSGAEAGIEIPDAYWRLVESHWMECQLANGQWNYSPVMRVLRVTTDIPGTETAAAPRGTFSMTLAGIASLFVTHDYLDAPKFETEVGRDPFSPSLARGLKWLEEGDNAVSETRQGNGGFGGGYTLYGVERVGLASGFKYFGTHDWYRELAELLIRRQQQNGSFGDSIETAYCLLFLARGRHPIVMNKLRFDGAWANRPRDAANLARFAGKEFERPLNWQVVPIDREWQDWADSPVLYLASHRAIKLEEADLKKLRRFVEAGGLLFTQSDGGNPGFNVFIAQLGKKLFPAYEWTDLPITHDIYSLHFKIAAKPRLRCISNGSRILMLHSPADIAARWQMRSETTSRALFQLGTNIFLYASGKTDLRNRLAGGGLPAPAVGPTSRMPVARIKYAGNWDPEPAAWERFARGFQYQTGLGINIKEMNAGALAAGQYPLAHLTGTAAYRLTDEEIAALRRYVQDGGALLIDACGGGAGFDSSVMQHIGKAFPEAKFQPLAPTHKLFVGGAPGMTEMPRVLLRPGSLQKTGPTAARMLCLQSGKGCVIYSPLDLSTGILGTGTHSIIGYQPAYAQGFVSNLVLWTWDGMPR